MMTMKQSAASSLHIPKSQERRKRATVSDDEQDEEDSQLMLVAESFHDVFSGSEADESVHNYSSILGSEEEKYDEVFDDEDGESDAGSDFDAMMKYSFDEELPQQDKLKDKLNNELHDLQERMEKSVLKNPSSPLKQQQQQSQQNISHHHQHHSMDVPVTNKQNSPYKSHSETQQHHFDNSNNTQDTLRYSINSDNKREYEYKIIELERKVTELEERVIISQRKEQQAKQAYSNESELVRQLRESNEVFNVTINSQTEQMTRLQQELELLNNENHDKSSRLHEQEVRISQMEKDHTMEVTDLRNKLKKAIQEIKKLRGLMQRVKQDDIKQLKHVINQKEHFIEELRETLDTLKDSNTELDNRCRSLFDENAVLRKQLIDSNEDRNRVEKEYDQKCQELNQVQSEFKQFENEFRKIKSKYDEFLQTYNTVVEDRRNLKKELELKEVKMESLQAKLKRFSIDNNRLTFQLRMEHANEDLPIKTTKTPEPTEVGEPKTTPDHYPVIMKKNIVGDARGPMSHKFSSPDMKRRSTSPSRADIIENNKQQKPIRRTNLSGTTKRPTSASAATNRRKVADQEPTFSSSTRNTQRSTSPLYHTKPTTKLTNGQLHNSTSKSTSKLPKQNPDILEDKFELELKRRAAPPKDTNHKQEQQEEQYDTEQLSDDSLPDNEYLRNIPFYKDTRYLKKKLMTERKRVELKNLEIEGLKELIKKLAHKEKKKYKEDLKKKLISEMNHKHS
jgi:hypothetical protein